MATVNNRQRLPSIAKEDVFYLKAKIQDLESQCAAYKQRLDGLRKAKNNLIIKKTTEYVKTSAPQFEVKESVVSRRQSVEHTETVPLVDPEICREHERLIERLSAELNESTNLVAALRCENDEAKSALESAKAAYQMELAKAVAKQEEAQREVKNWEIMYNDWMKLMEERVTNINRTHNMLQMCMEETNPNDRK